MDFSKGMKTRGSLNPGKDTVRRTTESPGPVGTGEDIHVVSMWISGGNLWTRVYT